ncbi:hypothetical protein [Micromonospora sp. URMC 103]|uniref:hypothetical protein n=1 Tax=Micromonospora sp. URMC 103 TaxID=3423406 RepID=UPI003F1CB46E
MTLLDVRRLAAIDLHGSAGSSVRRRVILTEFAVGVLGCLALGGWLVADADGPGDAVLGGYFVLLGLNYVPLTLHAVALRRPEALARELAGVDIPGELRRYTVRQLWVLVPLLPVALALRQSRQR